VHGTDHRSRNQVERDLAVHARKSSLANALANISIDDDEEWSGVPVKVAQGLDQRMHGLDDGVRDFDSQLLDQPLVAAAKVVWSSRSM
jgi:hypothetical protein